MSKCKHKHQSYLPHTQSYEVKLFITTKKYFIIKNTDWQRHKEDKLHHMCTTTPSYISSAR